MEEKFYVIEITKYNNGTKDAYAIYAKDTLDDALKLFHQKIAAAIGGETIAFELCQVINEYGVVFKNEYYIGTAPTPNEEQ